MGRSRLIGLGVWRGLGGGLLSVRGLGRARWRPAACQAGALGVLESHADTIELLVSELLTNALRASEVLAPGVSTVRPWLCSDRTRVVIQVWDVNPQMPVRQNAELEAESGRGLLLVESLSAEYGTYRLENPGGKVVWAVVAA